MIIHRIPSGKPEYFTVTRIAGDLEQEQLRDALIRSVDMKDPGLHVADINGAPLVSLVDDVLSGRGWNFGKSVPYSGLWLADENGAVISQMVAPDFLDTIATEGAGFSSDDVASADRAALTRSGLRDGVPALVRLRNGVAHVPMNGQSLSTAQEAWPVLTTDINVLLSLFMLGDSIRPNSKTSEGFTPLGVARLNPLAATVQTADFSSNLTPTEVAALAEGTNVPGEQPEIAALITLKERMLDIAQLDTDPDVSFVATACGVGGKTIAELSDGADLDLYARFGDAIDQVKSIAVADGKEYYVPYITFMQGRSDMGVSTTSQYKAALNSYFDDMQATVMAKSDQTVPPVIFMYQSVSKDLDDGLDVGQAQLELSLERADVFLVASGYAVTDKGTHLDANGSRWMGCYFGKAIERVFFDRENHRPVYPTKAEFRSNQVLVSMHVPRPPLQVLPFYLGLTATTVPNHGFTVYVDGIQQGIASVDVNTATVLIKLTALVPDGATVNVRYGDKGSGGNIFDSDPYRARLKYEYTAGSGQYAAANIAALVNKPYPMQNPCVEFSIAATEKE